jgi:arylsulfatase
MPTGLSRHRPAVAFQIHFAPMRRPRAQHLALASALAVASLLPLACKKGQSGAWPLDIWTTPPEIEVYPFGDRSITPFQKRTVSLGGAEVRDMSKVPPDQAKTYPKESGGQIHALEQLAGSRLKWHTTVGDNAYFSFVPLGAEKPCAPCSYRMGIRKDGKLEELSHVDVQPIGRFAPAAIEVDMTRFAGQELDVLLQIDGPTNLMPGMAVPSALWGSPMLYQKKTVAAALSDQPPSHPNILLIGIDTLRADAVGVYSARRPSLTPSIDRLASHADIYLHAWSTANSTNPSFASIHSGLYLKDTGVYDLHTPLPKDRPTLAAELGRAGYDTMAVISAHHLGDHNSGLGRGFQSVTTAPEHFAGELPVDLAIDWIAERAPRAGARPFFVWLHVYDPHTPHVPPEPYADGLLPAGPAGLAPVAAWVPFRPRGPREYEEPVLAGSRDLYDGEVAYVDRQVGRLVGFLESHGMLEQSVVALVADHGENEGEHGLLFRHVGLWDTTTHVPLIVHWPGAAPAGRRIEGMVQTIDLFPALLKTAGIAPPASDGKDLRDLTAPGRTGRPEVFAEHANHGGAMVRTAAYQYIVSKGNGRIVPDGAYLYDLAADPGETVNLAGRGLPAETKLAADLTRWLADRRQGAAAVPEAVNPEDAARLRSLGY